MPPSKDAFPHLWICGDLFVRLLDVSVHPDTSAPLWDWNSAEADDLSDDQRRLFLAMDDVKPVRWDGTDCVLATSSSGGVVLIRRADRRVLFCAHVENAHSAELLPDGHIVVAGSDGKDHVVLFHASDGPQASTPRGELPFPSAHSSVWDRDRKQLWAGGRDQVIRIECQAGTLRQVARVQLPDSGAHDLAPNPLNGRLIVTTHHAVWEIDRETTLVTPFGPLARIPHVKAVSIDRASGAIAFQKGQGGNWWSDTIYILTPDGQLKVLLVPGARLYKTRWDQPQQA